MLSAPVKTSFLGFGKLAPAVNTGNSMRLLIIEHGKNEYVRKWAERIIERIPDRDHMGEANAIFEFLQDKTRYANDPRGIEYIQTPEYVLKHIELGMRPSLDCDDYTVTGLSLLRSIGYKTRIKIVGFRNNNRFSHVYGMVKIDGKWVAFDCVRKDWSIGTESPNIKRVMMVNV